MGKKKLIHFQENLGFPFLFQPTYPALDEGFHLKSRWCSDFFGNSNPLVTELGCGKGEYTVGLAGLHPEKNYIGIDLKGARLWRGCKWVEEKGLRNAAFLRTRVDHILKVFGEGELSEIWITFPDPQPGKERLRLTSPIFIDRYRKVLRKDGIIHLKTDDEHFFRYTLQVIAGDGHHLLWHTFDLYGSETTEEAALFRTYYEMKWLEAGKKIHYLRFQPACI